MRTSLAKNQFDPKASFSMTLARMASGLGVPLPWPVGKRSMAALSMAATSARVVGTLVDLVSWLASAAESCLDFSASTPSTAPVVTGARVGAGDGGGPRLDFSASTPSTAPVVTGARVGAGDGEAAAAWNFAAMSLTPLRRTTSEAP